jgi:hypothetical protein
MKIKNTSSSKILGINPGAVVEVEEVYAQELINSFGCFEFVSETPEPVIEKVPVEAVKEEVVSPVADEPVKKGRSKKSK